MTHFVIFHPYDKPTFKTKALHLVSNEGWVKHFLQLYKRLIQLYLSLLWLQLVMHFVTKATTIDDIDDKSYKTEVKSSRNYSTNRYLWPRGYTHTHTHTHANTRALKVISRTRHKPGLIIRKVVGNIRLNVVDKLLKAKVGYSSLHLLDYCTCDCIQHTLQYM